MGKSINIDRCSASHISPGECGKQCAGDHPNFLVSYVPSVPWTFCPFELESPHKSAQTSQVSLGPPDFFPGTLPWHSDHQIPSCDFSLSFFLALFQNLDGQNRQSPIARVQPTR